jgi:hypothetical protein
MLASRTLIIGDPSDPWTSRLIDQSPRPRLILDTAAGLPDRWPDLARTATAVVVHTPTFDTRLAATLRLLRRDLTPGIPFVLCQHPLNRYAQIEPHVALFSDVLTEATALEVLGRHLDPTRARCPASVPVLVVSNLNELGLWLAAAVRAAGFEPRLVRDWHSAGAEPIAVWDFPVLDGIGDARLRREGRRRAVVVVANFLDRSLVERLRSVGARACLDLPCDGDDLSHVLHRLASALPARRTHYLDPPSPTPSGPHNAGRLRHRDPQARFAWDGGRDEPAGHAIRPPG